MPLTDTNSNLVSISSSGVAPRLITGLSRSDSAAQSEPRLRLKPRNWIPKGQTITFSSQTFLTRMTNFTPILPRQIALSALTALYFRIQFNLSHHGEWYNAAPMERIVIEAKDVYLTFAATEPGATVPWDLVRHWVEAVTAYMDRPGGFVGFYVASFEYLGADKGVSFWVETGLRIPAGEAATAA
ncbi:MAG: hypothetical protein Q9182_004985 [Xanthomendoza sp. 2 TL-2023]